MIINFGLLSFVSFCLYLLLYLFPEEIKNPFFTGLLIKEVAASALMKEELGVLTNARKG
jgi:hypothetical protein